MYNLLVERLIPRIEHRNLFLRLLAQVHAMQNAQLDNNGNALLRIIPRWQIIIGNLFEASRVELISLLKQRTFKHLERLKSEWPH
jgi:hypothetical protein